MRCPSSRHDLAPRRGRWRDGRRASLLLVVLVLAHLLAAKPSSVVSPGFLPFAPRLVERLLVLVLPLLLALEAGPILARPAVRRSGPLRRFVGEGPPCNHDSIRPFGLDRGLRRGRRDGAKRSRAAQDQAGAKQRGGEEGQSGEQRPAQPTEAARRSQRGQ